MTETLPPFLLTEAAEPPLPPQEAAARDRVWDMAVKGPTPPSLTGLWWRAGSWSGLAQACFAFRGCV
ncbi:hypothetical protein [Streptomyces geysiriensis]|uniref:hypothetical protein n=1 Tax=Streptomyces geysiriensis TaxID=68207 RepID=UPI002176B239|nr:hypothetical protein [Streptomyces geysiriensis]